MGAPIGNQFWKLRSKHGRDKLFATPELLWDAACEYFQWCDENPWYKTDFKGKDADEVQIPTSRPYTVTGLCLYLDCNSLYFRDFEKGLAGKEDQQSKDFSQIVTRIKETIETQQFEGAIVGAYNANIIARKLGLSDKSEVEQKRVIEYKNVSKQFPDR